MPETIGIIQARMGSSRLPGKILAPIAGRPLLALLADRLRSGASASAVDEWWVATTSRREDDLTAAWAESLGLRVHRGAMEDVLSRYCEIIRERDPKWILRLTADNPFCDAAVLAPLLEARDAWEQAGPERAPVFHICRDLKPGSAPAPPLGYGAQLALAEAVLESEPEIPPHAQHHRAHVLSWLEEKGGRGVPLPADWPDRPEWRWTVDTAEDLAMAQAAFALFGESPNTIAYPEMVALLDDRPDVTVINQHVRQKAIEEG